LLLNEELLFLTSSLLLGRRAIFWMDGTVFLWWAKSKKTGAKTSLAFETSGLSGLLWTGLSTKYAILLY
jgi:hypothetical protein